METLFISNRFSIFTWMKLDKHNIYQYIDGASLYCYGQGITSIEDIPDYITIIFCYNNKLTQLPKLPSGLVRLDCEHNELYSLPKLPDSLIHLWCHDNKFTSYTEGDPHSGYPDGGGDKQWMINHNKLLHRSTIINKINDICFNG